MRHESLLLRQGGQIRHDRDNPAANAGQSRRSTAQQFCKLRPSTSEPHTNSQIAPYRFDLISRRRKIDRVPLGVPPTLKEARHPSMASLQRSGALPVGPEAADLDPVPAWKIMLP